MFLCTHVLDVGRWTLLGLNGLMVAKILLSFLVVVLNYIISKFLVFRSKNND